MDIEELKERKELLRSTIQRSVDSFIHNTGSYPEITITFTPHSEIGGATRWIPQVGIKVFI